MDQQIGTDEPADPAAAAFEALRRQVPLLNVAVGGLAAERAQVPDHSDGLAEIAKGVGLAAEGMEQLRRLPVHRRWLELRSQPLPLVALENF